MRLRITIAMLEIRNRKTLQSKVNICKSDVKISDYADSLQLNPPCEMVSRHLNRYFPPPPPDICPLRHFPPPRHLPSRDKY